MTCSRNWRAVFAACLIILPQLGCLEDVSDAEFNELKQLRAGTHEVVPKNAVHVNRYEHFTNGMRTWRFDTATGAICVLLTSDTDWEDTKTKSEACPATPIR